MPGVISVERADVSVTASMATEYEATATLSSQDPTQCVPFASRYRPTVGPAPHNDSFVTSMGTIEMVSGPSVRVKHTEHGATGTADNTTTYAIYVVEFATDVVVQQGTYTIAGTATTVDITSVDTSRAALVFYGRKIGGDDDNHGEASVRGFFQSATQIGFSRHIGTGSVTGHWYVFEDTATATNFTVQSVDIALGTSTVATGTITSIDDTKSFVIASQENSMGTNDPDSGSCVVSLTGATTVVARRDQGPEAMDVTAFVVTFGTGTEVVERGDMSFGTADTQATGNFTNVSSVDEDMSMAWTPVHGSHTGTADGTGASDNPDADIRIILDSGATGVTADRNNNGSEPSLFRWEVVQWVANPTGTGTATEAAVPAFRGLQLVGVGP